MFSEPHCLCLHCEISVVPYATHHQEEKYVWSSTGMGRRHAILRVACCIAVYSRTTTIHYGQESDQLLDKVGLVVVASRI